MLITLEDKKFNVIPIDREEAVIYYERPNNRGPLVLFYSEVKEFVNSGLKMAVIRNVKFQLVGDKFKADCLETSVKNIKKTMKEVDKTLKKLFS